MKKRAGVNFMAGCVFALALAGASYAASGEGYRADGESAVAGEDVVSGMLALAGVGKGDVVYDLGYGDGRIVIEAARRFGCRGQGIYCDPHTIDTSVQAARDAGVGGLVSFSAQDVAQADISSASVVALYLLPRDGVRLRPKLLSELRPGTRCISRDFSLGRWRPEGRIYLGGNNVYYWVIPANISGVWKWSGPGNERYLLKIGQVFQDACGYLDAWPVRGRVTSVRIFADKISIALETEYAAQTRVRIFRGTVRGDLIEGVEEKQGGSSAWTARRTPGTAGSIDPDQEQSSVVEADQQKE